MIAPPPSNEVLLDIERYAADRETNEKGKVDPRLKANHVHWRLYSESDGYYRKMSRRQWIERYVKIRTTRAKVIPLILNAAQRRLLAMVLRLERDGVPVRVIILKARQLGFSTLVQAMFYERTMRLENQRALIIAHRDQTSKLLLKMAKLMLRKHNKDNGQHWDFSMDSKRLNMLRWAAPTYCEIEITSAEVAEPGHGDTCQMVHCSETSRWPQTDVKMKGIMQIVHDHAGTMVFDESTANGDEGYFRDQFWSAWNERHMSMRAVNRTTMWVSMFFAWFEEPSYRWTKKWGEGREIPQAVIDEIMGALTDEEEWLLRQTYWERGVGRRSVDVDQLLWRRIVIKDKLGNSLRKFHEQYPARPEEAFVASGSPAYDAVTIAKLIDEARANPPIWRGNVVKRVKVA